MVAAVPSLMLTYGSDTTLFGFSSTSQQFSMLGSGANANLEALGGSETDYLAVGELLWCRVKTAATGTSTVRLRHNGANGNNTFSIGSGQTGAFSDSTRQMFIQWIGRQY